MIDLIALLADGRITPDIERWVFEDLPFTRALCYRHALLMRNPNVWTVSPDEMEVSAAVREQVEALVASLPVDSDE